MASSDVESLEATPSHTGNRLHINHFLLSCPGAPRPTSEADQQRNHAQRQLLLRVFVGSREDRSAPESPCPTPPTRRGARCRFLAHGTRREPKDGLPQQRQVELCRVLRRLSPSFGPT